MKKIASNNVICVGSTHKLSSTTLIYNIRDIVSLILNSPADSRDNPYSIAYRAGSMDCIGLSPAKISEIFKCMKAYGNDKRLGEGYSAILGSYIAGYLYDRAIGVNVKGSNDGSIYGSLLPFIDVYVEIAHQKNTPEILNSLDICKMFAKYCANHSLSLNSIDDSFAVTPIQIQESGIMPKILEHINKVTYYRQYIPTDTNKDPGDREFISPAIVSLREYLLEKEGDPQYVENQVMMVQDSILTLIMNIEDFPDILPKEEYFVNEVRNNDLETGYFHLKDVVPVELLRDLQGTLVNQILGYYYDGVTKKDVTIDEYLDDFFKFLRGYFKNSFYPEFLRNADTKAKSRSINDAFKFTFRFVCGELVHLASQYVCTEAHDYARYAYLQNFWKVAENEWNRYEDPSSFKDLPYDPFDLRLNVDGCMDFQFQQLMSILDSPVIDEKEDEFNEKEPVKVPVYDPVRPITEAKHPSIRYQEKQGSRIGTDISKAYESAKENAGNIIQQIKKIGTAVYKWATTDGDNDKLVLDGRKFTFPGLIKRLLMGAALFNVNAVAGIVGFIFLWNKQKKANKQSRRKMIMMLEEEIQMTEEKIQDASADGNRKAKYTLMRNKNQLQNAVNKLKYGYGVDLKDEEAPAVREVRERASSGGRIGPNDNLRTVTSGHR